MLPIEQEYDGINISIIKYTLNKRYNCKKECYDYDNCSLKKKCSINKNKSILCGTEVIINILNAS